MDSKYLKPYNQRLIKILDRAIRNAKIFNLTTEEMENLVSELQSQGLNLFELLLD